MLACHQRVGGPLPPLSRTQNDRGTELRRPAHLDASGGHACPTRPACARPCPVGQVTDRSTGSRRRHAAIGAQPQGVAVFGDKGPRRRSTPIAISRSPSRWRPIGHTGVCGYTGLVNSGGCPGAARKVRPSVASGGADRACHAPPSCHLPSSTPSSASSLDALLTRYQSDLRLRAEVLMPVRKFSLRKPEYSWSTL